MIIIQRTSQDTVHTAVGQSPAVFLGGMKSHSGIGVSFYQNGLLCHVVMTKRTSVG